jgi:hypothetical protein
MTSCGEQPLQQLAQAKQQVDLVASGTGQDLAGSHAPHAVQCASARDGGHNRERADEPGAGAVTSHIGAEWSF